MNTKSNLLKSIFISLILVMGVANMSAATITSDGTARLYFNMSAINWWTAGTNGDGNFGYFFNNSTGKNAWSAHSVNYSGNTYYVVIPAGTWAGVILTRNNTSTSPSWDNKWNQTGDITLSSTSNYISKFSEGSTSVIWGTAVKPTSSGSLSASSTSINIGANVTLTPSLTSNQTINDIKSTSYSISPNSGASISGNTFTATKAGTYIVTATITYNPDGYTSLTSTVKPTVTITVKQPTYSYTVTAGTGGRVTPTSGTVAQGSGVTIEATPDDGYEFDKWTATNGTLADANSASTTFTPSANNAKAAASFKLAGCTQTPTTPTSLTAKVGGNALAGAVCSGTNVTLTAGGTISVGSLQWGTGTVGENIIDAGNGSSSITVSPAATTTYWVRSIITEAGVCEGVTSDAKTLQVSITPALVQPVLSKSTLTLEEGGSTGSITVTSGTTGGTWTSSDQNVATVDNGTVTSVGPGTATITYTVSNGCEEDKTATCDVTVTAKPYYIAGRLQQNWNTSSKTQQFTYVSNGQYKYETRKTVAELSAQWQDNSYKADQYFFIHAGGGLSKSFASSSSNGHKFHQKLDYANALTLSANTTDDEKKFIKFADANDNSSDVVIWWEPSTNKLWYTATTNLTTNLYLLGLGSSNWTVNDSRRFVKDENDPTKAKVIINLAKGEYKENKDDGFKIKDDLANKWYGNNGTMTRNSCTSWSFEESKNNAGLTADIAGDYVFTLDLTTMKLSVTYPTLTQYTITYHTNGGDEISQEEYNETQAVTLPKPTRTGYTFAGWFDNAGLTGDAVAQIAQGSTGDKTFYAKWTATEYTITYENLNGVTHSNPPTYTIESEAITFTNPISERAGYTFKGWNPTEIAKGSTGNKTVTAQWTANEYNITFDQQSGTGGTNSVTATYDADMPSITVPTRTGYHFDGYYTETNGGGTQYYNADGTSKKTWDKTENATLYAYFKKAEITGIAFETGEVPEGGYVIFTPTISPTPAGETVICWELKKGETTIDNSYIISVEETNNVKISIAELVANKGKGIYTIKATLRTGTGCESGTELSSYETNFANTDFILSTPIYLKPSATWQQHDARFAVYYWGNGENNNGWVDMNTIGCSDEYYAAEIPIGYSDFKFVRLDPAKTENNWSNRWCETGNLTIPNDGKNLFDMTQMYLDAQQGWTSDNARFAAYFYVNGNSGQEKWMSMSHVKDKIYKCDIPDDYNFDWVIFGRMDGNNSTNGWNNGSVWNQTSDLELTSNNVTHGNYYTITKFENGTTEGSWSWDNIAWSKLDLPTITITNNDPTCGSISVKTIDGTEITSGMKVDWDTEVIVSIQPEAGYAVKSSSINIGGNSETVQSGKTYTICDNTTISISFEEKGEWYLAGEMNKWEIKDEYKLVDGKILVELDGKVTKYFKLVKKTGETKEWWGSFNFKGLSPSGKLNTNSGDNTNCSIETVHDGDYLFVWDENTKTLTIEYPDVIFLHGSFNEWKDKAPHALHDRDAKVYLTKGNTYEFKVAEKGVYWTSDAYATTITESGTITLNDKTAYDNPQNGDYHNCKINATVTGLYTFHFDKETQILTVTYPEDNTLAVGDYRLQYTNETNSYYTDHVKKRTSGDGVDTVSLFILNAGTTPRVILQQYSSGTWTNVTTYNLSSMTLDDEMTDEHGGVWNFIISQTNNGVNATVSNATTPERYTGKYYIRTDAADGGWNEYMIPENEIFFSSYARDNEGFDYYYCKYIGSGTNVKYNIANDYNSKLNPADYTYGTGDLIQSETLPADGNMRFMWNSRTNELVGRAYLDGSSTENFLRITDATNLQDLDGNTITYIKFADLQNWIYQVDVQANTDTKIKLRAIYNNHEQFFKGDANNTVSLLTSNNSEKTYKIRLIYNFKTNHLVCAWLAGDETINTDEELTADMMIIRRDQEIAEQLSFNPNTKQLNLSGTAYAVMTFTKAFIQNETYKERQRSLYWVSFPFDVKISDVFGFGEYGEHWILQYYDGEERAKKGLFIDSGTYWKYITNTETILKKGVGYVLALDLNKVQFLHGVKDVSLYFPSTGEIGIIKGDGETTTMEVPAHQCTITHGQMDRRIYDSHWNLIGIPGFTDPGMIDVTNYNNQIPEVFLKEDANLGFHYEFDLATNTYNVKRSTVAFKTMYSYLVQYYGRMEWNISAIDNTPAQIAARRNSNSNVPEKVSLRLEIAQNEQMIDQTFVQLQQEKATAEFDMNLDLTKIINSGANIYTLAGTNRIQTAGNTLPMNNATVPVGVVISKAGEYTFRMPDGTDGILVELIDYETNTTTNLLYDEYTVNLTKGTFENRFALFVRPNNTATSLENINGESTTNGKDVRKVLIDNILYIVRDGQMFDARGVRVQ